jgi:hypothetical protein
VTELSAHSAEFLSYSAEFCSNGDDFWTTAPASVHTRAFVTSTNRSATESTNNRHNVPCNQHSNSLPQTNHLKKSKNRRIVPNSRQFFNKIRLPRVGPHPLSPATELLAHSIEFLPYSVEFCSNGGDFWTTASASVACSSGARSEVTGLLFGRHRGEEIASMCVVGQVGLFLSYLIHFKF